MKKWLWIVCCLLCFKTISLAQMQDTSKLSVNARKKLYSGPRRAAILSAVLPGLGQAYNKKYWKIPIVYGALGGLGYFFIKNQTEYKYYQTNLKAENDGDNATVNGTGYTSDQLLTLKTTYRKRRDLFGFGLGLTYILNIVDANIDAHLKTFDISDDLSLKISPKMDVITMQQQTIFTSGISFKLTFK
jgi:hypothetical protein